METPSSAAAQYDLGRVRYVTERFGSLQGLRVVPLGLYFLIMSAGDAELIPYVRQGALDVSFGIIVLCFGASWLIGRYYDRRFGRVAAATKSEFTVGALMGVIAYFLSGFVDARLHPPVSLSALFIGAVTLYYWNGPLGRRRTHYAVLGAVFVLLGLSPLVTATLERAPLDYITYSVVMGVGIIACGVLDHVMLAGTLRPLPPEDA